MWDVLYAMSNISISFLLGVVLGNVLQGLPIGENYTFENRGFFQFLNPYSILTGITTLALFMKQGALFLLLKSEGNMCEKTIQLVWNSIIFFVVSFSITSLYTLIFIEGIVEKFRNNPVFFVLPVLSLLSIANIPRLVYKKKYFYAFIFSSLTMAFLLMLVAFSLYPVLLLSTKDSLYNVTIYNAASSIKSLKIMLTFVVIGTPLIALYFGFLYSTFRGRVKLDDTSYKSCKKL